MAGTLIPKRKVVILHETATIFEAARAMCSNEIGCILVCDSHGALTGTITDRDLTCAAVARNLGTEATIDKVMTKGVCSVDDRAGVEDVVHTMKEHGIRRVAITKEDKTGVQKCTGLVSLDDLISSRLIQIEDAADIIRAQILHRQHFIQPIRESEIEADPELKKFIEQMEERSGLTRNTTLSLLTIVMSAIVRSVHYSVAEDIIKPLPERLRSRLEDLPAGPDQAITADFIVGEVVARFNLDPEHAGEVIRQFWDGILVCCSQNELEQFTDQLPSDLQELIAPASSEIKDEAREKSESENPMHMH